ncbi:hypothetical protein ACFPM0_37050 [Pseudonocardia sulfidoxydans]|uniref:hypothetical protein n=1 Tax=Pseudonocardia sulfidoxydans TaxID=54011 RepID=UPI00360FFA15
MRPRAASTRSGGVRGQGRMRGPGGSGRWWVVRPQCPGRAVRRDRPEVSTDGRGERADEPVPTHPGETACGRVARPPAG